MSFYCKILVVLCHSKLLALIFGCYPQPEMGASSPYFLPNLCMDDQKQEVTDQEVATKSQDQSSSTGATGQDSGQKDDDGSAQIPPELWQKLTERAKEKAKKELVTKMAKDMDISLEIEEGQNVDPIEKLTQEVHSLKESNRRQQWEADHPELRNEENREVWTKIVEEKGTLVSQGVLSYDELYRLSGITTKQRSTIPSGSVPHGSSSAPKGTYSMSKEAKEFCKKRNITEEEWKKLME